MRIIVTGGTGLIGRALSVVLAADSHEVIVLSRDPDSAKGLPAGVRAERWDGRTAAGWGPLADGAGAIVNLAGANLAGGRWTARRKELLRSSRLKAGRAVVEAVRQASHKPVVVIQASGVGYYGFRETAEVTESAPPGDDFLARLAVEWEDSTREVEPMGVRRAIIRTAGVLARDATLFRLMLLPHRFFVGGPLGSGRQGQSWIHIADEVGAIRFLLREEGARGPFNLVAPQLVSNAEFERLLGRAARRPAWLRVPALPLRLVLGEMASLVVEGQRAVPRRLMDLGYTFRFGRLEQALQDLLP